MSEWTEALSESAADVMVIGDRAAELARAASTLGMEQLATSLAALARRAYEISPRIQRASIAATDEGFKQAQRTTSTLFEAVLAGVTLGERKGSS